jgi:UDP-glucose 4-epimerase
MPSSQAPRRADFGATVLSHAQYTLRAHPVSSAAGLLLLSACTLLLLAPQRVGVGGVSGGSPSWASCEAAGGPGAAAPVWSPGAGARVLVTGAAGFIGSHVARVCAEELGMTVVGVDDMSGGFDYNLVQHERVTFVRGDLRDAAFVAKLFAEHGPFTHVYHLAAYAAEGLSHFIRGFNYDNNLVASMHVLNAAINGGTRTFVFTSSIAAYGAGQTPMTEATVPQPEDPYGVAKYAVELDLRAAHEMFGIDFVIFRPHNVYGTGQNVADRYRNVIGIFMRQLLAGEPLTIFGDGSQTRAFSFIDDVAPYIARSPLLAGARNQVFNVGADRAYTLNELAAAVATAMGSPGAEVRHLPARNEVQHAVSTHDKLRCVFRPERPPVSLEDGLAKMAAWVIELNKRGAFTPVVFENIEVAKNMPPSWAAAAAAKAAAAKEAAEQAAAEKKAAAGKKADKKAKDDKAKKAGGKV